MPRYQKSRELDPIVGVSITGLFDFFVKAFGVDWLRWWQVGRPEDWNDARDLKRIQLVGAANDIYWHPAYATAGEFYKKAEKEYLLWWKQVVHETVWEYCDRHGLKRPNRCTTVQPAGCLDRTALRVFDQGLLYADEIVAPGSGETTDLDLSVRGGIGATTAIANQPLNLVKVVLGSGRILRMTPNHRLSVDGQWVYAADMKPGMKLDYSVGEYRKEEDALLLPLDSSRYTREGRAAIVGHSRGVLSEAIKTPAVLIDDLAYFLGALYGNGYNSEHKSRTRFSHERLDILHRLSRIGRNLFGLAGTINEDGRGGKYELCFASVQLYDWLHLNGLAKTTSSKELERIPRLIRESSWRSILSFFAGLIDTDGCPREKGSLSIDMSAEAFLRNCQQVGEAVGLCFSFFENTEGNNFQEQKQMYGIGLSRMLSTPEAIAYINKESTKCRERPIPLPKRTFKLQHFVIESVEFEPTPDYSYDFAIEGMDDDDSWYWQGGVKSHNTKSLLTGASPGWHPPKAQRYIRRITFRKGDPVALACLDYGYSVVPSQSDKDENGVLLADPFDSRCTEWLVEIPCEVSWANLPGADEVEIEKFSALAQFDFYMQVQKHYTTHNTSATLELSAEEVEPLGDRIYQAIQNDEGYISAALLARFDAPFPRLPFEKIDKGTYDRLQSEVLSRRKSDDFHGLLAQYDGVQSVEQAGPAGCDSDKCMLPEVKPN